MRQKRNAFKDLEFSKEIENEDEKISLINKMYDLIYKKFTHKERTLKEYKVFNTANICEKLCDENYYIFSDETLFIGKKIVLKGRVVQVDKISLVSFLKKEDEHNEETIYICMPVKTFPDYIFTNDDDWNIHYIDLK